MLGRATAAVATLALIKAQEDISEYVRETEEFANGSCSMADCEAGSAVSECNRWEYNLGNGWTQLMECDETNALAEAKEFIEEFNRSSAKDDIGQLLIQLEAVLKQREMMQNTRSAANCGSANLCDGDNIPGEVVGQESFSQCVCHCQANGEQECAVNPYYQATASPELTDLNKYKNLKGIVMVLQPVSVEVFTRYCYYGCWCLPNGQHNFAAGYGQPIDPIDEVCKEFALCYKCIDIDFAGGFACAPETRGYRWGQVRDGEGVTYDVKCKDDWTLGPKHRCKRYMCECDRVLSVGLSTTWMHWNESHHERWGGFDRETNCAQLNCVGCLPQDDCCGGYGEASGPLAAITRRPYATTSANAGCCGDVFYYSTAHQECCLDGSDLSVVDINTCSGVVKPPDAIDDFDKNFPGYS